MIDKASKEHLVHTNDFFEGIKTCIYAWLIIGAVVGLFYLSFACHWG